MASRIPPVPSMITGPWAQHFWLVNRQLNGEAYISKFSGTNPNVSAITGIPGDLVVNVGSASDNSRLWVKSGSTVRSSTTGWVQLGLGGSGGALWTRVMKTAPESRTANTTLTADTDLVVSLAAATKYHIRGRVFLGATNATMDYKYDLNYTGTITSTRWKTHHVAAGDTVLSTAVGAVTLPGSTSATAATSGTGWVEFDVTIETNAAGTFEFRWAQNTSDAGSLVCAQGSYLEYTSFA